MARSGADKVAKRVLQDESNVLPYFPFCSLAPSTTQSWGSPASPPPAVGGQREEQFGWLWVEGGQAGPYLVGAVRCSEMCGLHQMETAMEKESGERRFIPESYTHRDRALLCFISSWGGF